MNRELKKNQKNKRKSKNKLFIKCYSSPAHQSHTYCKLIDADDALVFNRGVLPLLPAGL